MEQGFSRSSFRLDGQVALVTGAGRGLGRAIAHRLAELGAAVVLAFRNPEAGGLEVMVELPGRT